MKQRILAALAPLLVPLLLTAATGEAKLHTYMRPMLGTLVNLTIIASSEEIAASAARAAFGEIDRVEKLMSPRLAESDVSRINARAAEGPVHVSADTFTVITLAQQVSRLTGGAFDASFASAGMLWDFSKEPFSPPEKREVLKLLPLVNYKNVFLNKQDRTVRLAQKGMKIGLGGVAKGYAVGKAIEALKKHGVKDAIVEAGGDLKVIGSKFGNPWRVGLMHPREKSIIITLTLKDDESIVTSGDYERFAVHKGVRYHHIIDPATGYPAQGLLSVSVIAKDPALADAYATALFVMGKEKAIEFLSKRKDLKAILIDPGMKIYASKDLKERIAAASNKDINWLSIRLRREVIDP